MQYNAGEAVGKAGMRVEYKDPDVPEKELNWIPKIVDERITNPTTLGLKVIETIAHMNNR